MRTSRKTSVIEGLCTRFSCLFWQNNRDQNEENGRLVGELGSMGERQRIRDLLETFGTLLRILLQMSWQEGTWNIWRRPVVDDIWKQLHGNKVLIPLKTCGLGSCYLPDDIMKGRSELLREPVIDEECTGGVEDDKKDSELGEDFPVEALETNTCTRNTNVIRIHEYNTLILQGNATVCVRKPPKMLSATFKNIENKWQKAKKIVTTNSITVVFWSFLFCTANPVITSSLCWRALMTW